VYGPLSIFLCIALIPSGINQSPIPPYTNNPLGAKCGARFISPSSLKKAYKPIYEKKMRIPNKVINTHNVEKKLLTIELWKTFARKIWNSHLFFVSLRVVGWE